MTEQQARVAIGAPQADEAGPTASTPADSAPPVPATGSVPRPVWASLLQPGGADVPVVAHSPSPFATRRDEASAPAFGGLHADRILASLKGMVFSGSDPAPTTTAPPGPGAAPSATPLAARSPSGTVAGTPSAAATAHPATGAALADATLSERTPRAGGTPAAVAADGSRPGPGPNTAGPTLSLAPPGLGTPEEQDPTGADKSAPQAGQAGRSGPGSVQSSEAATGGTAGSEAHTDDILPAPRKRAFSFSFRWR
jgi:hypothetical protein